MIGDEKLKDFLFRSITACLKKKSLKVPNTSASLYRETQQERPSLKFNLSMHAISCIRTLNGLPNNAWHWIEIQLINL